MVEKHAKEPTARAWLYGGLMTAALWLVLSLFTDIHFGVNDDQFIMRTFSGFVPGGSPDFHLYIHGMYAYPLKWLNALFPGFAWFSALEIALLSLALVTIQKSVLQCCRRAGRPLWVGLMLALSFSLFYGLYYLTRITYTVTAAMLGAAAVAQTLSVDCRKLSDGGIYRSMLYALLLVALCYGLRQMTALPVLAYCGAAFLLQLLSHFGLGKAYRRSARPMTAVLLTVALLMGGLALLREAEITAKGQRDYLDWQQARISVLDYIDLEKLTPEALEESGWTETELELLLQWNTMDEKISTEAFRHLRQHYFTQATRTGPGAAIEDLRTRSPHVIQAMLLLALLGTVCLISFLRRRRERLWELLALLCVGGFCFAFFCYLALQGRLPYRAVTVVMLPAAAFVFCLMPEAAAPAPKAGRPEKTLPQILCLLLALCALCYGAGTVWDLRRVPPKWEYNTFEDMDAQALAHPNLLLIYDTDLVNDMRMFPDVSNGAPANLMFWGGWQRGSPEYLARLAAFGVDGNHFSAQDWLRPELRYLSLKGEPNELLLAYLRENLGPDVAFEREKVSEGLYFYRFYRAASGSASPNEYD